MPVLEQHRNQITGVRTDGVGLAAHRHGIAFHPLPRPFTAAAPLAGGDGATPPPVAPTVTARPPRAVAGCHPLVTSSAFPAIALRGPDTVPVRADRRDFGRERRLVDERPIFTPAEFAEIEAEVEAGIALPASPDRWLATGGDAVRALTDREWRESHPASDDLPGHWQAIVLVSLIVGFAVAFGVGLARLVTVLL